MNTISEILWSMYKASFSIVTSKERVIHLQRLAAALDDDPEYVAKSQKEIGGYLASERQCRAQVNEALAALKAFKPKSDPGFIKRVDDQSAPWSEWYTSAVELVEKIAGAIDDPVEVRNLLPALKDRAVEAEQLDAARGLTIVKAARAGHDAQYGTDVERKELYKSWQSEINSMMSRNAKLSYRGAMLTLEERGKGKFETIRKHTNNPRKK